MSDATARAIEARFIVGKPGASEKNASPFVFLLDDYQKTLREQLTAAEVKLAKLG